MGRALAPQIRETSLYYYSKSLLEDVTMDRFVGRSLTTSFNPWPTRKGISLSEQADLLHRLYKQKLKVRIHSVEKVLEEGRKAKELLALEHPKGIRCCEDENHRGGCACCTDECCECECLANIGIPLPKCVTVHGAEQGSVAKMLFVSADNRTLLRERRLVAQVCFRLFSPLVGQYFSRPSLLNAMHFHRCLYRKLDLSSRILMTIVNSSTSGRFRSSVVCIAMKFSISKNVLAVGKRKKTFFTARISSVQCGKRELEIRSDLRASHLQRGQSC